ncbi:MAG: hypothetical protein NWF01_07330 [Candidatus Bathyarchaeota archaeon]|nr:hypothetical protein [Candidatus Bathyarchaeota archaeon]
MKKHSNKYLRIVLAFAGFCLIFLATTVSANPPGITLTSCDSTGTQTESYTVGQAMCLSGTGFAPSTTYNVYVVNHTEWTEGRAIPERVAGSATSLTTDESGEFFAFVMWSTAEEGVTDMLVDADGNGVYNSAIDALDDNHVTSLFVVPEYPLGVLIAVVTGFVAFVVFKNIGGFRESFLKLLHLYS